MAESLEMGQMLFGNPTGDYGVPDYADALIQGVLYEIERVCWNRDQYRWERCRDPNIPGMEYRPYWWGDEDHPNAAKPNLSFGDGVEIRWYKYPGRGSTVNRVMSATDWVEWFDRAIECVRSADVF